MIGGAGYLAGRNAARQAALEQDQSARIAELESEQAAPPPVAQPALSSAPSGGADLVSKLKELSELQSTGALTDEEFQTAKQRLLAG